MTLCIPQVYEDWRHLHTLLQITDSLSRKSCLQAGETATIFTNFPSMIL